MDALRFQQIEAAFEQAAALPLAERGPWLAEHCAGDAELRCEVEEMLEADAGSSWIGATVRRAVVASADEEPVPEQIGVYRILGEIGRGGLATVLLGERSDDAYRMQVAIKLVRRGLDTADLLKRLRQERQILARLDHPNIARLLDGGSTEDGRPYVVMERIEGVQIDLYCREQNLDLRARLELFIAVCEAVAYSHRNLIIHRDIKPANILVTADGQPKLLDFGIAKLLRPDQHNPRDAAMTLPGLRLLTPEYASPEQVQGKVLTTATDVYSLGILLYELLVGERPYRLEARDAATLERLICGTPPEPPSQRAYSQPTTSVVIPAARLRGDLDTIVLAALRKEPERRYPSVEQLADDVSRYLQDLPIRARPESKRYRAGKFVRRHRAAVAGGLALIAILLGATFITARQAVIAEQQRQRAEAQSARTERVSELLVRIFKVSDPGEARGNTITAREILDRAADNLETELGGEPADLAAMAETMGRVYRGLGLLEPAGKLYGISLDHRRALWGEENAEVARSLGLLGELRFDQGRQQESLELVKAALEIRRRLLGEEHPDTLSSLNDLAALRFDLGDYQGAEELFRLNLETRRRLLGEHADVAAAYDNLATVLVKLGRSREAEELFHQALDLRIRLNGEGHPEVVGTRGDLAALLHSSGRVQEAEPLYRQVLADQIRLLGADHIRVALTTANLAALLRDEGKIDEAEKLMERAIEIQRLRRGAESLYVSYPIMNLADLCRLRGGEPNLTRAEELYREALAIRRQALRPNHPDLAAPLEGLARLELARSRQAKGAVARREIARRALALAEEASTIRQAAFEADHPARRAVEALVEQCRQELGREPDKASSQPAEEG